ncbi:MAG: Hint domain-containing protein [Candidatus Paceibacterota bacterium]
MLVDDSLIVLTSGGGVSLGTVQLGQKVISPKIGMLNEIVNISKQQYSGDIYVIYLPNGKELKVTCGQNIYTENRGWVTVSNLSKNDILLYGKDNIIDIKREKYNGYAYLVTMLYEDGFYVNGVRVR